MKIRTQEIYNCEHCNKLYLRKKSCETHEKYCMKNEANIPKCFGCEFLEIIEEREKPEYTPRHFFCKKRDEAIHPMKVQGKIDRNSIYHHRVAEHLEESYLMPKECDLFEYHNGQHLS